MPKAIDGRPVKTSLMKRTASPIWFRPYSERYIPIRDPIGTASREPIPTISRVPMMALKTPPPGTPCGNGGSVKKPGVRSPGKPLITTKRRSTRPGMAAIISESTMSAQGQTGLPQRPWDGADHVTGKRNHDGQHHDGQHHPGRQEAVPAGRPLEKR